MKTLQNNFTTPEQSKLLLELGVPADSADCYFEKCTGDICIIKKGTFSTFCDKNEVPCWSVGRLMEIMNICSIHNIVSIYRTDRDVTQIDIILETIINRINGNSINFSKLEE